MDLFGSFAAGDGAADVVDTVGDLDLFEVGDRDFSDDVFLAAELCGSGAIYADWLDVTWEAKVSVADVVDVNSLRR